MAESDWKLMVQFPATREGQEQLLARLVPEGLIRIWNPIERSAWYRLSVTPDRLPRLIQSLLQIQRLSKVQVFVNREQVPIDTLWALNCYANPESVYRLCELQRSQERIIGCPQGLIALDAHHPSAWYLRLKPNSDLSEWHLPEPSWNNYFKLRIGHFHHCPELSKRGNLDLLHKLPTVLSLKEGQEPSRIFTPVRLGDKSVLRVKDRSRYEGWLYGSVLR